MVWACHYVAVWVSLIVYFITQHTIHRREGETSYIEVWRLKNPPATKATRKSPSGVGEICQVVDIVKYMKYYQSSLTYAPVHFISPGLNRGLF
jgi:hypothetical protein